MVNDLDMLMNLIGNIYPFLQPWDNTEIWVCDITVEGDNIIFTNRRKVSFALSIILLLILKVFPTQSKSCLFIKLSENAILGTRFNLVTLKEAETAIGGVL